MYCASWDFGAAEGFQVDESSAFLESGSSKQYSKCQTLDFSYKKLKRIRDLELNDKTENTQTDVTYEVKKCSVIDQYEVTI